MIRRSPRPKREAVKEKTSATNKSKSTAHCSGEKSKKQQKEKPQQKKSKSAAHSSGETSDKAQKNDCKNKKCCWSDRDKVLQTGGRIVLCDDHRIEFNNYRKRIKIARRKARMDLIDESPDIYEQEEEDAKERISVTSILDFKAFEDEEDAADTKQDENLASQSLSPPKLENIENLAVAMPSMTCMETKEQSSVAILASVSVHRGPSPTQDAAGSSKANTSPPKEPLNISLDPRKMPHLNYIDEDESPLK